MIGTAARSDGSVLFRARLIGMTPGSAVERLPQRLLANGRPCFVVPADGPSEAGEEILLLPLSAVS